jgi:hypothetical protein
VTTTTTGELRRYMSERAMRLGTATAGAPLIPALGMRECKWLNLVLIPHIRNPRMCGAPRHSLRAYDPQPPRWEYPAGAWVLKVDSQGTLDIRGKKWRVSQTLAGNWVQIVRVEQRMLVFYCNALIRELDSGTQRSTIVERWIPESLPDNEL